MNILIVEDNTSEQFLIKEAFKEAQVTHTLYMVNDGFMALDFLKGQGDFHNMPRPDLIILDLNMPKKNGLELISDLKGNPKWAHIPILVFSNSEFPTDICRCYTMGVNAYLNKPADFQGFVDIAHAVDSFWFKLVRYCPH